MEETISQLKELITEISWAEATVEDFRALIESIPHAKKQIFKMIDKQNKGEINCEDICAYLHERGVRIKEETDEIIGNYFNCVNKSLNYSSFCSAIACKNISYLEVEVEENADSQKIFCQMVSAIIRSFYHLEKIRTSLSTKSEYIKAYFSKNYQTDLEMTKQSLKEFMYDHGLYSRLKFAQVAGYIYGDSQTGLKWDTFLRPSLCYEEKSQQDLPIIPNVMSHEKSEGLSSKELKYLQTPQVETPIRYSQNSEIDKVLNQIDEIQKNMKQRKLNNKQKKEFISEQETRRANFVGKLVKKTKETNEDDVPESFTVQKKLMKKLDEYSVPMASNKCDPTSEMFENYTKYFERSPSHSSKYQREEGDILESKLYSNRRKILEKSASEAEMKIQQIQKRAMDKFLSKKNATFTSVNRLAPYSYQDKKMKMKPTDWCYEPRLIRENSSSKLHFTDYPIYTPSLSPSSSPYSHRQFDSRYFVQSLEYNWKPYSPRLLRY